MIRDFVAVFKDEEQAYYARFHFEIKDYGIEAYADYVRTWPEHNQLSSKEKSALLDKSFHLFEEPMKAHIAKEMSK